ncbi:uncharacterized protein L201_003269 [Kwoniella dendrophila CBS 6074]|uniref:Protein CWC15 n=1 Tax=Kwoniella dendrophila CBS 6074 TaxID=1295534 RepID=A0AAX4JU76_9TREE
MSQAHRPTWNPTQGRETKAGSQQISKLSLASHTKLKFRQPGQTNSSDVQRRDLKLELQLAERNALEKKRKAQGLPPLPPLQSENTLKIENGGQSQDNKSDNKDEDDQITKRRKILEEAAELDKDDDDDDDDEDEEERTKLNKGKGKQVNGNGDFKQNDDDDDDEDEDDDSDDSDDEDDTAALMAELAKIKQERAEEKARQEAENAASSAQDRESEIALGNPLLNLQAALGQSPSAASSTTTSSSAVTGSFTVKRRWDDDLIFKNQASNLNDPKNKKGEFVNDLLRSEFHKKFMNK